MIRSATPNDAQAIAHVHVEARRTTYRSIFPASFLNELSKENRHEMWRAILTRDTPKEFTFVAELDGEVVGFTSGGPERKNDPSFAGELIAIYLLEAYRGRGIGTSLFKRAVEQLVDSGMNSMKVWVLQDNPYQGFYERRGGIVVGKETIRIAEMDLIKVAYGWNSLEK